MKAEELRIGNYVYYNDKAISIAPNAINEFYYIGDTHSESLVDRRCYEPIELTEEILLKVKDIKQKEGKFGVYYYIEPYAALRFFFNGESMTVVKDDKSIVWIADKKYLHDFQNLFFALTNEELQIDLQ